MKHWLTGFVLTLLTPSLASAQIGITTPTVNSGELIRAADWNKVRLDLETIAAAVELLQNQSWSSSGADIYFNVGSIGMGTATPAANLHIYKDTPNANDVLLQIGTSDDPDRFAVDEDGDVTMDGKLVVRDSDIYESGGDLEISGEDNLYLSVDWNNNDADTNAILFGKNSDGAGVNFVELMRIDEGGNVGIGTPTPNSALQVAGSVQVGADAGACDGAKTGAMRYNGGAIERCNGVAWDALATTNVSDNLGNHTATQDLDLDTFKLVGQGGTVGLDITSAGFVNVGDSAAPLGSLGLEGQSSILGIGIRGDSTIGEGTLLISNYASGSFDSMGMITLFDEAHADRSRVFRMIGVGGSNDNAFMDIDARDDFIGFNSNATGVTPSGYDLVIEGPNVGIGVNNPTVPLNVFKQSPNANDTVLQVGTSSDADRFRVDEDGDTFMDGNAYINGGNAVTGSGGLTIAGEDNLYLAADWDNNDADSRSIIFGKNGTGGSVSELARIDEDGNIGINNNLPQNKLHITESNTTDRAAVIENVATTGSPEGLLVVTNQNAGVGAALAVGYGTEASHVRNFVVTNAGTVGVGDPSPDSTLLMDVEGQIGATEYCDENGLNCRDASNFAGKFINGSDPTEAVYTGGNVGIGTTNPNYSLQISDLAAAPAISLVAPTNNSAILFFGDSALPTSGRLQYNNANDSFIVHTAGSEALRVNSSGNVGIGSTNPGAKLEVDAAGGSEIISVNTTSTSVDVLKIDVAGVERAALSKNSVGDIEWTTEGGFDYILTPGGNVGIGTAGPGTKLTVAGNHVAGVGLVHIDSNNSAFLNVDAGGTNNSGIIFDQAGTQQWILRNTGTSDELNLINASSSQVLGVDQSGEVDISSISGDGTGKVVCIKSDGNLGTCSDAPDGTGACSCS